MSGSQREAMVIEGKARHHNSITMVIKVKIIERGDQGDYMEDVSPRPPTYPPLQLVTLVSGPSIQLLIN